MLDYLSTHKVGIRLLEGEGVIEDSTFKPGTDATPDGRPWSTIVGVGTNPTRIVVNHLYDKHGSVNLVLHERAHTLDYYGAVISSSVAWNKIMNEETSFVQLMQKVCGDYCTKNPVEAFAEGFAIYFSCEQSRRLLNDSPLVLAFMKSIEEAQTRDEIGHLTGQSDSLVSVP
jgi:hypothetical protein